MLLTISALTAVENKIPDVSNLVKKIDYDTKISKLEKKFADHSHDKYITSPEFNKLTAENLAATLAQGNLITKTDFNVKLSNLNRKITSNNTKHLAAENELKKLKSFDSSYFIGKSHFDKDGSQNYLVFQTAYRHFKNQLISMIAIFFLDCLMKVLSLLLHLIKCLILQ